MSFDFRAMAREGFRAWGRDEPTVVAFDTETTGVMFYDTPFCVSAAWRSRDGGLESHYFELDDEETARFVFVILCQTPTLVGHNIKFDLQKTILSGLVRRQDLHPQRLEDTEALAHLLDEHRRKKLKLLAKEVLGLETDEDEVLKTAKEKLKKERGLRSIEDVRYDWLPREIIVPYAVKDAEFTLMLYERLIPAVTRHADMLSLYRMEMELTLVLLDMEAAGFGVDFPYAETTAKEYGRRILQTQIGIEQLVGKPIGKKEKKGEFNPSSVPQVKRYFAEREIEIPNVQKKTLKKVDHPLATALLELKVLTKMHSTYLSPILVEYRDGLIHPNFRQHGTKTGRMSSGEAEA